MLILGLCTQPLDDDWIYRLSAGRTFNEFWHAEGEPADNFSTALRSIYYHYIHSNGRLSDKLLILFSTILPSWLGRTLCTFSFCASICFLSILTCGSGDFRELKRKSTARPLSLALLLLIVLFLLPWSQSMLSLACAFNYLFPSGLCAWTITKFLKGNRMHAAEYILAFLAGSIHESFSLGIIAGMALMLTFFRSSLGRAAIGSAVSFLCGTLLLMLAPGTWVRMGDAPTQASTLPWVVHTLLTMPLFLIFCAVTAIYILSKLRRKGADKKGNREFSPTLIMLCISGLASMAVGLICYQPSRAYWPGLELLAAAIMLMLMQLTAILRRPCRVASAIIGTLLIAWFSAAATVQYRFSRESVELEKAAINSPGKAFAWVEVSTTASLRPWMAGILQPPVNEELYNLEAIGYYACRGPRPAMVLPLPARYRGKHFTNWDTVPGNVGLYGSYPAYYAPRVHLPDSALFLCKVAFSIEDAPLHAANLAAKLRGQKIHEDFYSLRIVKYPKKMVEPRDTQSFIDPATGQMPDSLTFILLRERPRPALYAPLKSINK